MKHYLFVLSAFTLMSACSESQKEAEKATENKASQPEEIQASTAIENDVSDTVLVINKASIHTSDYGEYRLNNGKVEVWLNNEKVDHGLYRLQESILSFDLESQTNEVSYQWKLNEDGIVNLSELGSKQTLEASLIVN